MLISSTTTTMFCGTQQRPSHPCVGAHTQRHSPTQQLPLIGARLTGRCLTGAPAHSRAERLGRHKASSQASASYGPVPPPPVKQWKGVKPEWVKDLEADAPFDADVARLLENCGGDPELIRKAMRESMASKHQEIVSERFGEQMPMQIKFREVDPFNLWIWFELYKVPSEKERELITEVIASWFMVGRLGGYNAMNMQVFNNSGDDHSYLEYDADECESSLNALFHDMSEVETKGCWLRMWVNMGTGDELALDILVNAFHSFSKESVGIKQMIFGGENKDWEVPKREIPRTSIDPMQGPVDLDDMDDLEDMDLEDY